MKTLFSIVESLLAIPLGILSIPLLLSIFVIRAIKGKPGAHATVITMNTEGLTAKTA
ncbi:MAG: hypothetical protein ACI959_000210 [Limisphaerales bacterium]|jgi:hypothetical protein